MPYVEQLLYGHNHLTDTSERQTLAQSAGMGADVAAEVGAVCDAWGHLPELGLSRPVLLAYPLQAIMPSMRGRLFTVIRVAPGTVPLFHAVVLNDVTYLGFGRNPYGVAPAVEFFDAWNGKQGMDRIELESDDRGPLVVPAANAADVGLVDEAVLQFILEGTLQLPLEHSVRDSERALALMIACLPEKDRKDLKFASFTTAKVNAYDLACIATEGATFASWQRLMMARIDSGVTEQQQEYKHLIARYLTGGDLAGIERTSSRHNFSAPPRTRPLVATKQGWTDPVAKPKPVPAPVNPRPMAFGPAATINTNGPGRAAAGFRGPGLHPGNAAIGSGSRPGPVPEHGLDPVAGPTAGSSRKRPAKRKRIRSGAPLSRKREAHGGRILRSVAVLLLLFFAGWVGTLWLEGRTLTESLEWAGLPGMDGHDEDTAVGGTLLGVVDVGRAYDRALNHIGGKGLGLSAAGDKGRQKALGRLQSEATEPLLDQAKLFVELSSEGIQQSGRPDREVERLRSLAGQGAVLAKEMTRLELAWYSLTTGVNWADVGTLPDAAIAARRDSLDKAEKGALKDVRLGMDTVDLCRDLDRARRQMDGMAGVVALFQSAHWSAGWERDLEAAAEKVSPSVGTTTRAYRNCAFAFLRLKRAERQAANRQVPFAADFVADRWPSGAVRSILPKLRKEAGRFADRTAPGILGATLSLYASLEKPARTIDGLAGSAQSWRDLQANAAVRFDPELYGDFLERLRFEAASRCLASLAGPATIPGYLYPDADQLEVAAFGDSLTTLSTGEQWQAMAAGATQPFLARWAGHLAAGLNARLAARKSEFSAKWAACQTQVAALQEAARGGRDWSAEWRQVYAAATDAVNSCGPEMVGDPAIQPRLVYLDTLRAALEAPRPLHLTQVTVRLDPSQLAEPCEMQLELRTPDRGGVWTSEPFQVGPAAPAGTGWVGTVPLAWQIPISPRQRITGQIVAPSGGQPVLTIAYPGLAEGDGVAALARTEGIDGGSLTFRAEMVAYWRSLIIPQTGLIF